MCYVFPEIPSGVTPADLLVASMADKLFSSMYLWVLKPEIYCTAAHSVRLGSQTLYRLSYVLLQTDSLAFVDICLFNLSLANDLHCLID